MGSSTSSISLTFPPALAWLESSPRRAIWRAHDQNRREEMDIPSLDQISAKAHMIKIPHPRQSLVLLVWRVHAGRGFVQGIEDACGGGVEKV